MQCVMRNTERFKAAIKKLILEPRDSIIQGFLYSDCEYLRGFKLIYATQPLENRLGNILLSDVLKSNPLVLPFFQYPGLVFYDDKIREDIKNKRDSDLAINLMVSFDSNFAKNIRQFFEGKQIDQPENFLPLIELIIDPENLINFEYIFYLLEDYTNFDQENNDRPFRTLKALKLLDKFNMEEFVQRGYQHNFTSAQIKQAEEEAIETINFFKTQHDVLHFREERKIQYLVLLKATTLRWSSPDTVSANIEELIEFTLNVVGKMPNKEIYFGWKLLKEAHKHLFFAKIERPSKETLRHLRNMSWDLFILRYQEKLFGLQIGNADFVVPLLATYDGRFKKLSKACAVKCFLYDLDEKSSLMFHDDELDYRADIANALSEKTQNTLENTKLSDERRKKDVSYIDIDNAIKELEKEITDVSLLKT